MTAQETIARAVSIALQIAADARHGYSQTSRWGPDYDCSSFLITVWTQAGVDVKTAGATYTGNMRGAFLRCGFRDVTGDISMYGGHGLQRGDVLLNEKKHTAMAIGNGYIVHAAGSETGGIDGQTGDQTGREIGTSPYYGAGWDCVLRYVGGDAEPAPDPDGERTYTVTANDSLWKIAAEQLGDGNRWMEIYELNELPDTVIHPGQVLRLPPVSKVDHSEPEPDDGSVIPDAVTVTLPVLRRGSSGRVVETLQLLLQRWRFALPVSGPDGDFGTETETALTAFQAEWGLAETGETDAETWTALIG